VQGTFGTAGAADTIMVIKRSRGEANATLHVSGRDVMEQELALRFEHEAGGWEILGDAAEFMLGESRKTLLAAVRTHGALTPKQASQVTNIDHEVAKKTMQRMYADGQLLASKGVYTPVPPVPASLLPGTEGQEGHGYSQAEGHRDSGDTDLDLEEIGSLALAELERRAEAGEL
jgi:hypothetical protein